MGGDIIAVVCRCGAGLSLRQDQWATPSTGGLGVLETRRVAMALGRT